MNFRRAERPLRGFTLAELLVAMVIASMASAVLIRSLSFSLQFYQARSNDTAAQLLCETVFLLVQDDLTHKAYNADANSYYQTPANVSTVCSVLNKSCYGFGESDNASRTVSILVEAKGTYYNLTVSVANSGGTTVARQTSRVTPLGG